MTALDNPYARSREPVYAMGGMVATSQPLAAQAGLAMLREGGNAIDAAIATATALSVVEPSQNGIGGDAFALIWNDGQLHAYNGSGRSPAALTRENTGLGEGDAMPLLGWASVTVPGAPKAWAEVHARFGRLPLERVMQPAIHYARNGYPLGSVVAEYWRRGIATFAHLAGPEFAAWKETFLPAGFSPEAGRVWRSEAHAHTLERIAASAARDFYSGDLTAAIDRHARETGGYLRAEDLAVHRGDWITPISTDYLGHTVWEIPPNTQAIAALEALNILSGLDLPDSRDTVESIHLQIEAMKLAFVDALAYVGDPDHMQVRTEELLSPGYAANRRQEISETACHPEAGAPSKGDTVYLATADADGMMVSFIQSNYLGFGSGVVVPGTGIALHNRGNSFQLKTGHPNEVGPGKRPYHTIMPGFLTRDGKAVGPFGVMGAYMQPQGHVQMMVNSLNYGLNPQASLDAPRWQWTEGRTVRVEQSMPAQVVQGLLARGHNVIVSPDETGFGRGQIIWRNAEGVLCGGSECRADGQVAAF
ncbi:gamma-glutamyltranspeptidase/glutathione hydrolase [Natronocella acetinitrilica]|uniref:Gamma-glutamyltranspeptidase/glutathione hydrolase n=1 Tax=Natronocella acetinitrilica TaxID=414046 RepID=A0AAE3KIC3_9GAMM|nr:gamma-glutamyltransferase family protein [Natronocella acetinitrilica]MCP1677257.1 gamma-glutamyltranspeptidase/glutathione hydrolase [Natronocella acetinitrilica]